MERDYLAEAFRYADDPRLKGEPHILALVQRIREQDAEMERLRKDLRELRELKRKRILNNYRRNN